jgi:hypothetical protein
MQQPPQQRPVGQPPLLSSGKSQHISKSHQSQEILVFQSKIGRLNR